MAKYTVITPVRRDGKRVLSGGTIELSDSAASSLLILGAIKADSMAEAEAEAQADAEAEAQAQAQAEAAAKNSKTKGEKLL